MNTIFCSKHTHTHTHTYTHTYTHTHTHTHTHTPTQLLIPEETPLAADVDFEKLAHFEMSGGNIKSAVFRAASRAALRLDQNRVLTMRDLEESAEEESGKNSTRTSFRRQDSAKMYS